MPILCTLSERWGINRPTMRAASLSDIGPSVRRLDSERRHIAHHQIHLIVFFTEVIDRTMAVCSSLATACGLALEAGAKCLIVEELAREDLDRYVAAKIGSWAW